MLTKEKIEEIKTRLNLLVTSGESLSHAAEWYKQDVPAIVRELSYWKSQFEEVTKLLNAKKTIPIAANKMMIGNTSE